MVPPVSVIIPLAPGETEWRELVAQLDLAAGSEIILACGRQNVALGGYASNRDVDLKVVSKGKGRAEQMNAGAEAARHDWLWFLHADSRMADDTLGAMQRVVGRNNEALYFFDLKFLADGPAAMRWNELTVKWRAGMLKMPFGDQGFLIRKDLFDKLGQYRVDVSYGEDHLFVWKVRQEGYRVERAGAPVFTSARRYKTQGWLSTTSRFVWRTILQGVPQRAILLYRQVGRAFG